MSMKYLIATTALSLVLAAPTAGFAADPARSTATAASINTDKLLKADLKTPSGDRIGEIESVLLDKAGKSQAIIVDVGGFLGMGEHRVALSWNDVTVTKSGDQVISRYSKDQLKAMPTYQYPDAKHRNTAYYDPSWTPAFVKAERSTGTSSAASADFRPLMTDMKISKLIDADIRSGDDTIGEVQDAIADKSGKIRTIVVDVGGFLGIGNKHVALDFDRLQINQSGDELRLATSMTKDQLKALPEFDHRVASSGTAARTSGGSATATDMKKSK